MSFAKPDPTQSAVPLRSVSAVVVDTETTGLDVTTDRVIQIGAARLVAGRIDGSDVFDELVNPGIPIPKKSTRIHGLDDGMVASASGFVDVMHRLSRWAGPSLVIGFSIGFDLAMLKSEHERAGLSWQSPQSLDVAHLVQVLSPNLPSVSLSNVAAWLGVEQKDAHQALGDALTTARVYLALLPKLREKGIFTLAEAERACSSLSAQLKAESSHGWHEGVSRRKGKPADSMVSLAAIDSFPYRHRLREIMHAPPVIASNDLTVEDALRLMMQHEISSVFLPPLEKGRAHGILTERDVLRAIDKAHSDALRQPIDRLAARPLVMLDQDEFVYRAISKMTEKGFRHLGVHGPDGQLVGALSARDLLKQRASQMITLGDNIATADTAAELGRIWAGLSAVAGTLVREEVDARDVAAIISSELRALTKRACEIAEKELLERGQSSPPSSYTMLVLGSGGRGESLLAMDQDNAIVYRQGEPGDATDQWFEMLGQRVSSILDDAGVAYCRGGVMASKAQWRMSIAHWRKQIAGWIKNASPKNILSADIFFDGVPVHGQRELADDLMRDAIAAASRSLSFLGTLSFHASDFEAPIGWFGRFKLKMGRVDLKKGGLMALFATARVLALRFGLSERSTRDRFTAARDRLDHGKEAIGDLIEAHRVLLDAILRQQLRDLDRGIPLSNAVAPSELTGLQRQELRWALDRVNATAELLGSPSSL